MKSFEALDQYNPKAHSFLKYCRDQCEQLAIDSLRIDRSLRCQCAEYSRADSTEGKLSRVVENYLTGLSGLSKTSLTYINTSALYDEVKSGSFTAFEISDAEAKAYSGLTNLLLRGVTDLYRQGKLKTTLRSANPDLQIILRKWVEIEQNDKVGLLEFRKERIYVQYQSLLHQPGLSAYEKQMAAGAYYQRRNEIDREQEQIRVFSRTLNSIARGHQKIADNLNQLSAADLGKSLSVYLTEIRQLSKELELLQQH